MRLVLWHEFDFLLSKCLTKPLNFKLSWKEEISQTLKVKFSPPLNSPPQLTKITETCSIFLIFFPPNNFCFFLISHTHRIYRIPQNTAAAITDKIQKKQHILPFDCCRMEVKREARVQCTILWYKLFPPISGFLIYALFPFPPQSATNSFYLKAELCPIGMSPCLFFPFFCPFPSQERENFSLLLPFFSAKYIEWRCESHWCSGMFSSVKLNKLARKIFEDEKTASEKIVRKKKERNGHEWSKWVSEEDEKGQKKAQSDLLHRMCCFEMYFSTRHRESHFSISL